MSEDCLESRRRLLRYLATSPLALPLPAALPADDAITSAQDALSVFDFEEAARRVLPPAHWGYLATGVDDDRTLRANREAFERVWIRARHLVNVRKVDTTTQVLGQALPAPFFLCPVSSLRAFHAEGELAVARAARAEAALLGLSTVATTSIEDVTAARGEPVWFQLYPSNDKAVMRAIVKRAEAAGSRVVAAVAGRIPVLADSGFRRGTDIFKAIALGAAAVGIGRPYVWGLAAFGEEGVAAVLRMLKAELAMAMQTCGTPRISDVGPGRVTIAIAPERRPS